MTLIVYGKEMIFFIYMQISTNEIVSKKMSCIFLLISKTGLTFAPAKELAG